MLSADTDSQCHILTSSECVNHPVGIDIHAIRHQLPHQIPDEKINSDARFLRCQPNSAELAIMYNSILENKGERVPRLVSHIWYQLPLQAKSSAVDSLPWDFEPVLLNPIGILEIVF